MPQNCFRSFLVQAVSYRWPFPTEGRFLWQAVSYAWPTTPIECDLLLLFVCAGRRQQKIGSKKVTLSGMAIEVIGRCPKGHSITVWAI